MSDAQTAAQSQAWSAERIAELDRRATLIRTPCGGGQMVWRRWDGGVPVVLFHGGYGSWAHWLRNIEPLSRHHTVIAPDLPGLGESAVPQDASPEAVADIVASGLDAVLGKDEAFHLIGFSFGGILSGAVAVRKGRQVRSLTLVGAGGLGLSRPQNFELRRVEQNMSASEIADIQRDNLGLLMLHDPAAIDETAVAMQIRHTRLARLKSIGFAPPDWLARNLRDVQARFAGIWGEFDATAYPHMDQRKQTLRQIQPDAPFHVIPGAGHWVQYEAADAFNTLLPNLLAGT